MRRKVSIASVVLAVAVMLAAIGVPHHHHGATMCTAGEVIVFAHADHHPCTPQEHRDSRCVSESEYTTERDDSAAAGFIVGTDKGEGHCTHTYVCNCVECHTPILATTRVSAPRGCLLQLLSVSQTAQALRGPPCA